MLESQDTDILRQIEENMDKLKYYQEEFDQLFNLQNTFYEYQDKFIVQKNELEKFMKGQLLKLVQDSLKLEHPITHKKLDYMVQRQSKEIN